MSFFSSEGLKILTNDGLFMKDLGTDATTPSSNFGTLYVKSDALYFKYESNTSINISNSSGSSSSTFRSLSDVKMSSDTNFNDSLLIQTDSSGSAPTTGTLSNANNNIGIGKGVFSSLTSGTQNIAIGINSLQNISTGDDNVVIGENAGNSIVSGNKNVLVGKNAGSNLTGDGNVIVGSGAGSTLQSGNYNVIVGTNADVSISTAENQIVIGQGADGVGNNKAVIGNSNLERLYANQDGDGTIYAGGHSWVSDIRIKKNITNLEIGLNLITNINPVTYNNRYLNDYDDSLKQNLDWYINNETPKVLLDEEKNKTRFGLIAQELYDELIKYDINNNNNILYIDNSTTFHRLDYTNIIPILIKSVQELSLKNKNNQNTINNLENQ